ncbi:unnamed protein product [Phytophthora lilii]|uniref:Unnamed protein product n=1 Tax=Phytophthora lilii TaxID=2077276 RepID=A0A9W6THF3_9STRA|nr:unnamed protein product [Phytophthora lilii]
MILESKYDDPLLRVNSWGGLRPGWLVQAGKREWPLRAARSMVEVLQLPVRVANKSARNDAVTLNLEKRKSSGQGHSHPAQQEG